MKPQANKRARKRRKPPPPSPAPAPAPAPAFPADDVSAPPPLHVDDGEQESAYDEQRMTLEWLMGAFSSASLREVESACLEAQGDAYRAAGILAARGMEKGRGRDGGKQQKKKAPVEAAATGLVSDVIGKAYRRTSAGEVGEKKREGSREMELERFLFGMMGEGCELDADVIRDVLGHCGHDLEKAVDKLLDISSSTSSLFKSFAYDDNMPKMKGFMEFREGFASGYDNFDDKLSDKTAESSSGTSETDQEQWYPTHCGCGEETCLFCNSEKHVSLSQTDKQELQKKVLLSLFSIPDHSQKEPKIMDWKKVVKKMEPFGQGLEFSVAPANGINSYQAKAKEDIYQTLRGAARQHWDTMRSYYQRAAVAYSKGDRAHASYLSEKGSHYSKLAREADEKASREIFEARNRSIQNEITIDLHGQHVQQAIRLLKLHLLIFTYTPSIQLLRVITGCGSHGIGKGKLKQSVIRLADKEGIQWREENAGTILMKIDSCKEYSFIESDDGDLG